MNFLLAALLFFLAWWFADQGLFFFSFLFIIVLVITAIAAGNKAPQTAGVSSPTVQAPEPKWDNTQIEEFGRNLGQVVALPFRILWTIIKWIFGR